MKKKSLKIAALLFVAVIVSLSSFTYKKPVKVVKSTSSWEEYGKITAFINKKICTPISKEQGNGSLKMHSFSRCPSGYQPQIAGEYDSAKVDKYVEGKIKLYSGCHANHICDFKVYVSKNIALVRTDDKDEFVTVGDWLKKEKTKDLPPVKEKENQIEG